MQYYSVLLPLALILALSKVLSKLSAKLNMPQVVGMLLTGIIIGLINYIPNQNILNETSMEGIGFIAKLGVILIMFSAGLETDITANDAAVAFKRIFVIYKNGSKRHQHHYCYKKHVGNDKLEFKAFYQFDLLPLHIKMITYLSDSGYGNFRSEELELFPNKRYINFNVIVFRVRKIPPYAGDYIVF